MRRWGAMICIAWGALSGPILPVARGVEEEPIAAVQAFLRQERLYMGPVSGVLDPPTQAGVRRYQILRGLRATGRLDDETLRRMLVPPASEAGLTDSDRQLLRDLAQMPLPDPSAEHRRPLPPIDLPVVAEQAKPKPEAKESKRSKRVRPARHRAAPAWTASD